MKDGKPISEINSISTFNDTADIETKSDGFLGETANRFAEIFNGHGGDLEFQVNKASWIDLKNAIIAKAKNQTPDVVFNVVRLDLFSDGSSITHSYMDVHWGAIPTNVPSRGDFVKVKLEFKCTDMNPQQDAV